MSLSTRSPKYCVQVGEIKLDGTRRPAFDLLFFGLAAAASVWVDADADTEVAVIPGASYRRLFEHESSVQDMTVKALGGLVFRLMDELEQVHACNLDQRLANFLLNHASDEGVVSMTQQALAGHLGTTREVVARLMQGLSAQGLVSARRGAVSILDAEGLSSRTHASAEA